MIKKMKIISFTNNFKHLNVNKFNETKNKIVRFYEVVLFLKGFSFT